MKYCPRCLRTEDQIETCPNDQFPGMNCPEPVEEDPRKDVAITCGPCDFSRIVPIRELLSGAAKNKLPSCRRDDCACVIVPSGETSPFDPVMPEVRELSLPEAAELAAEGNVPQAEGGNAPTGPSATPAETFPSEDPAPVPAKKAKSKGGQA